MTWISCLNDGHVHSSVTKAPSAIVAAPAANLWLTEPPSAFSVAAELLLLAFATNHSSDLAKSKVIPSASLGPNWTDLVAEPRVSLLGRASSNCD